MMPKELYPYRALIVQRLKCWFMYMCSLLDPPPLRLKILAQRIVFWCFNKNNLRHTNSIISWSVDSEHKPSLASFSLNNWIILTSTDKRSESQFSMSLNFAVLHRGNSGVSIWVKYSRAGAKQHTIRESRDCRALNKPLSVVRNICYFPGYFTVKL